MDANLAMALETENRRLNPETVKAGVTSLLRDSSKGVYFVAECDGAVAGQLLITREWSDWRNGNFWWIQSVFVAEKLRGRGIFRGLFDHVLALSKSRKDVCGVRLYVEKSNSRARQVYARLGLERTAYEIFELEFARASPR